MNLTSDFPVMVFKNDKGYSIGLSDKKQDGTYVNWYKNCSFKKGVELANKTNIKIKSAWLKCNEVNGKKYEYVFISDYEVINNNKSDETPTDPFIGTEIRIEDEELPF